MAKISLLKLNEKEMTILEKLSKYKDNYLGFTYSEISKDNEKFDRGNVFRILQKLTRLELIEKTEYEKSSDIKYTINERGIKYVEITNIIEEYKLFSNKVEEHTDIKTLKVEYWAGGSEIHSFESYETLKNHFIESKHVAYSKNLYRFFYDNGTHQNITLGQINSEDELRKFYYKQTN